MDNEIIGVIFPLPEGIAKRILNRKKTIFLKYLTHNHSNKSKIKLKKGIKLFIYISKLQKTVFGEALIDKVEYFSKSEVPKNYSKKLMLNCFELREYSKGRENKKMVFLHLKRIKRYLKPKKINVPITMAGRYLIKGDDYLNV